MCGISKTEFVFFYYKVLTTPLTLPKTMCLILPSFILKLFLLGNPKSHHHGSKNKENSKFKITTFHDQSLSKCLVHPNHVFILPLTLPPLCFGFHPRNPWKRSNVKWMYFEMFWTFVYSTTIFIASTCSITNGFVPTFGSVVLSSSINSICGLISKGCILDTSFYIGRIDSTFSCSWIIYVYFSFWAPPLRSYAFIVCTSSS